MIEMGPKLSALYEAHRFIINAGGIIDTIFINPESLEELKKELNQPGLTGYVTHYGTLEIKPDKYGIKL